MNGPNDQTPIEEGAYTSAKKLKPRNGRRAQWGWFPGIANALGVPQRRPSGLAFVGRDRFFGALRGVQ